MTSSNDFLLLPQTPPPAQYPVEPVSDEYSYQLFDPDYISRRQSFLAFISKNPSPSSHKAAWFELARMAAGNAPHNGIFSSSLEYISDRHDGSEIAIHAILRLLYQFPENRNIDPQLIELARSIILGYKYWPDETGHDHMCGWYESRYLLYSVAGYLAGQLFPDLVFSASQRSGKEMLDVFGLRIKKWMDLRFFTGFSEWLSPTSYDENLTALVNLVDFCQDDNISRRATILIDLILLDIALNSWRGIIGSPQCKSYENSKKWTLQQSTSGVLKLLFGYGVYSTSDSTSTIGFTLSRKYQLPEVLFEIANDLNRSEMLNRQQMSFNIDNAHWWSLSFKKYEDAMLLASMGATLHPKSANRFLKLMGENQWWENPCYEVIGKRRKFLTFLKNVGLLSWIANWYKKDVNRNACEKVNIYSYRTPDYMLSSAQDFLKGFGGDRQHLWQATLGPNAICFTTHPAQASGPTPNYWCGNGVNPRIAQIKNVLIAIHNVIRHPNLFLGTTNFYSHAWFPRDQFEETQEQDGWVFARWGEGYLALLSQYPYHWQDHPGEDKGREIIVPKAQNTWICEMGDKPNYGDFQAFIERILQAEVRFYANERVEYNSPSQGKISFGWNSALRQEGRILPQKDYPRYGNPYSQTPFPSEQIAINTEKSSLLLDWQTGERRSSSYVVSFPDTNE
jgi:hypothetical protein